jgi:hypothetical protein
MNTVEEQSLVLNDLERTLHDYSSSGAVEVRLWATAGAAVGWGPNQRRALELQARCCETYWERLPDGNS